MDLNIFHIDAFVSESCKGSTACIVSLDNWLSDEILLKISKRNSVPETAFIIIFKFKMTTIFGKRRNNKIFNRRI